MTKEAYEAREYSKALRDIMALADGINASFDAAKPWVLAKDESKRAELQDICSRVLHGFKLLSVLLAPVLPGLTDQVAKGLFMLDRSFKWEDASTLPTTVAPYQHLMQRVAPEQLDALFEEYFEASLRANPLLAGVDKAELASWTMVAGAVMNLYRTTTQQ
jgi:methionyl-tRNA synthetase